MPIGIVTRISPETAPRNKGNKYLNGESQQSKNFCANFKSNIICH